MYHQRHLPRSHEFQFDVFYFLLNLEELPELFDPYQLWSARGWAPAQFRPESHLPNLQGTLEERARQVVSDGLQRRPQGSILLLTQLCYANIEFNPLSVFYLLDQSGAIDAVILEVRNTPWNECHPYVLDARDGINEQRFTKEFFVSPYFPMDLDYEATLTEPSDSLRIHLDLLDDNEKKFDATLELENSRPITSSSLSTMFMRYPLVSLMTLLRIYYQALLLFLKGIPRFLDQHQG